jgi:hypothetical protein
MTRNSFGCKRNRCPARYVAPAPGGRPFPLERYSTNRHESRAEGNRYTAAFFECSDCNGVTSSDCSTRARMPRAAAFAADSVVMHGIL